MDSGPLASILLPVYNTEKYIGEAIQSALAQTEKNFELLVSDNGSTDRTVEIIESFADPRIRLFKQARNIGMVANWDFLLQLANGKYACLLGADDRFHPDHLARKIAILESDAGLGIVHGACDTIDFEGKPGAVHDYGAGFDGENRNLLARLLDSNALHIGTMLFRMDVIKRHQLHFDPEYVLFPDWKLWFDILFQSARCHYDKQPTADYRVHSESVTGKAKHAIEWPLETATLRHAVLLKYQSGWREIGLNPGAARFRIRFNLFKVALIMALRGKMTNASKFLRLAIRLSLA